MIYETAAEEDAYNTGFTHGKEQGLYTGRQLELEYLIIQLTKLLNQLNNETR